MSSKVPFRQYFGSYSFNFPEISQFALYAHALKTVYVVVRAVKDEGRIT
jgi:hypothetical protein